MIYELFIKTLQNPEKVKTFIQILNWAFYKLFWLIVIVIISIMITILLYRSYKKAKLGPNKAQKSNISIIIPIRELFKKQKKLTYSLCYLIIGAILQIFNRKLVSFGFHLFSHNTSLDHLGTKTETPELNMMFGSWSILSFLIFSFAPFFIAFCFWNKFIRNIWILIYIIGTMFIGLGFFLNLGLYI